jgi:glycosyltransferase involved in cell wall biosynthesis
VTVVMPTFRRPHQIGESLRTLLDGDYGDFEVLVRDEGDGGDGTREAVEQAAAGDPRVRYHRNPSRLGVAGNLNAGIAQARGELIAVCHDHDLYRPRYLAEMVAALDRHPSALYVHCAIDVIDQQGRFLETHAGGWPALTPGGDWLRYMLTRLDCPVCALSLVRRTAHERFGLYDARYGFITDVELWMRLARHGDVAYLDTPLIGVRTREAGHEASLNPLPNLRVAGRIHRRYIQAAYGFPASLAPRARLEARLLKEAGRWYGSRARRALRPRPAPAKALDGGGPG